MIDIEKNKKKFIRIATENIYCKNLNKLLAWLDCESDFYEAPASARHHLAEPGGLCLHSLNVYKRLHKLLHDEYEGVTNSPYNETSIAIVALFHDLCKANMYTPGYRNQKTYDPEKVAAAESWKVKQDGAGLSSGKPSRPMRSTRSSSSATVKRAFSFSSSSCLCQ